MRAFSQAGLLVALVSAPAASQERLPTEVRRAADRITEAQLAKDVQYLASDELRGRDTFSPRHEGAVRYIVQRLQRSGLKPIGDGGSYLQRFAALETSVDTTAMFVEIGGQRIRFGNILPFGLSGPVDTAAAVVFVGHGARSAAAGIDPYAGLDVRGKILLAQFALPPGISPSQLPPDFEGVRIAAYALGALAVLLIPTPQQDDDWDEIRASGPQRSYVRLEPTVPDPLPPRATAVLLRHEQVRTLAAIASTMRQMTMRAAALESLRSPSA